MQPTPSTLQTALSAGATLAGIYTEHYNNEHFKKTDV